VPKLEYPNIVILEKKFCGRNRDIPGHYGTLDKKETSSENKKQKENKRSHKNFSPTHKRRFYSIFLPGDKSQILQA